MGADVNKIIDMLKQMKEGFENDLTETKVRYFKEMQQCMDDIDALEDLIYRSQFDIEKYKKFIELDTDILEDREADLVRLNEELVKLRGFEVDLNA